MVARESGLSFAGDCLECTKQASTEAKSQIGPGCWYGLPTTAGTAHVHDTVNLNFFAVRCRKVNIVSIGGSVIMLRFVKILAGNVVK
jgi:hypothetical protein